jgi:hypothetical protein
MAGVTPGRSVRAATIIAPSAASAKPFSIAAA